MPNQQVDPQIPPDFDQTISTILERIEHDARRVAALAPRIAECYSRLEERLRAIPGNSVAMVSKIPREEIAAIWWKDRERWRIQLSDELRESSADQEIWEWRAWDTCPIILQARCVPLLVPLLEEIAKQHRDRLEAIEAARPLLDGLEDE